MSCHEFALNLLHASPCREQDQFSLVLPIPEDPSLLVSSNKLCQWVDCKFAVFLLLHLSEMAEELTLGTRRNLISNLLALKERSICATNHARLVKGSQSGSQGSLSDFVIKNQLFKC